MRAPQPDPFSRQSRIVVVGTSGAGKTTFARRLGTALDCACIELDALYWGAGWSANPQFLDRVREAVAGDRWVVDGNYASARAAVWSRATAVVWLRYPFRTVFSRAVRRTVRRLASGETLFNGNRESIRSVLGWNGIPLWVIRSHHRLHRQYAAMRRDPPFSDLAWIELRTPAEAEAVLGAHHPPVTGASR